MSIEQASPIVPIKQVALQNGAFIKNSHNRSSFCGVVPSPTSGNPPLKTFAVNRKSWSGNGNFSLTSYTECTTPSTPELATFKGTGTFPRNRERNNNDSGGLTPNGNSTFRSELRRTSSSAPAGRRYAEIGSWNKRSSSFLEPHLHGVVREGEGRDSSESDARDDRSTATEDEERALLRRASPRSRRKTRRNDNSPPYRSEHLDNGPDSPDAPLRPREFFERLQTQAMREERGPPQPAPRAPRVSNLRDSLSQSRESLSSDGEGARGDCSSVGSSSSSDPQPPCDIGLLERLIRTHPVWFLPGIQRAGAFHLLQGKEEGNFVVRQSSQPDTMAISVRLPADKGPYIEHYLIQASGGRIGLETSQNMFDNIPELIAHYSQCCDELPVQLILPKPLAEAKNRHQLNSLALLGQEFWGYPMANPRATPLSPTTLANEIVPMAITPSDTGSSLSSFNAGANNNNSPELNSHRKTSVESGSPHSTLGTFRGGSSPPASQPSLSSRNATFVRAPRPTPPSTLNLMSSTAHITQNFPSPQTSPTQPNVPKITPPPPPPRWAKPPFQKSTPSQNTTPLVLDGIKPGLSEFGHKANGEAMSDAKQIGDSTPKTVPEFGSRPELMLKPNDVVEFNHKSATVFSPGSESSPKTVPELSPKTVPELSNKSNITVTTTVTFSVNNTQIHNHRIDEVQNGMQLTLAGNAENGQENADSSQSLTRLTDGDINQITASLHGSFKRHFTEQVESPDQTDPINNTFSKSGSLHNHIASPNGSNSVTSGIFSPTSQINSPNETVSSKSGLFSPLGQITNKDVLSPVARSSPMSGTKESPSMKERETFSPNTNTASSTPSGRSRRSKHSMRKESRHYQESDILESPGVYCRSSLIDKVSDYEDIWGPESNGCSTFKPDENKGLMRSKRPDLLPDTLPKLNAAKSTQSILEKENLLLMASDESIAKKNMIDTDELISKFNGSSEVIATTNSKGEAVPKRPDQLNLLRSNNKILDEEMDTANKENTEAMEVKEDALEDQQKDKAGSPFYADPVDAIREAAALPMVQRRRVLRVGALAQRYSEPPNNHPYYPLRDMHSIEELSPSSPNTSNSMDNLVSLRAGRPRMKPVQPPRINGKPPPGKHDPTWTVDSSWEFINKNDEGACSESGTFPSLAEQESRLGGAEGNHHITVHHVVAQRFPELRLNGPMTLAEEVRIPPRTSCYDNVNDPRPISEQASDDGTVFSEPWDTAQWDGLLPNSTHADEEREWDSPISCRKSQAALGRAKSFRDRLDPLLAAGRVRALRGCRGSRGAGAALRAYALHLAQDKSTTFAQNVDHFIQCTLDSKEICPQVVMRNMRQFMSGMKNYLVKHGEREFEKEVEKERMKLKSTEFLNLDAILETVMHRLVVRPLRSRLYTLLADWHATDVRALHAAIQNAADATPLQMGIKASTTIPSAAVLATISRHFLRMQESDSPLDKLENLLAAISAIFNSIRGERALGADDLLPMLAWVVARCRLVCAELEAELMAGLLPPALLAGEGGYYLTALFSAVAVLKRLAPDRQQDAATLWRRSSLESSSSAGQACVVRVALPDECRGSIRRVALPCRPGARARDLCRALAHQAAITNPQDYALFALHNGQETMLSENDCPQEVMSEKNKNCILAYKRIDAKIAWPKQALLSLP